MLKTFSVTNIGMRRKVNQDYIYTSEEPIGCLPNLFVVADGMGGHNAGDYASRLATETIMEAVANEEKQEPEQILGNAISLANTVVRERAVQSPDFEGMGTTVVSACIIDRKLYVANVGDSRLYLVRDRQIRQVTRDHSWVEEMVRRGGMARDEARNHPDKNIITRAIGAEETVKVDFFCEMLMPGDLVLMCTDGLTNMLDDKEILTILEKSRDVVEKAETLVERANENGGRDNISVVLIEGI